MARPKKPATVEVETQIVNDQTAPVAQTDAPAADEASIPSEGIPSALGGKVFPLIMGTKTNRVFQTAVVFPESVASAKGFLLSDVIQVGDDCAIRIGVPEKVTFSGGAASRYLVAVGLEKLSIENDPEVPKDRSQIAKDRRAILTVMEARGCSREDACKLLAISVDPGPAPAIVRKAKTQAVAQASQASEETAAPSEPVSGQEGAEA